jgi:hypothetical protein
MDESVFEALNISRMKMLPTEILNMIRDYSDTSMIWRIRTVSGLVERFSVATTRQFLSFPLQTVSAWQRGGQPVIADTTDMLPIMRLTIDSRGLREIERLKESPKFKTRRTEDCVFVVLSRDSLEGINAQFQVRTRYASDKTQNTKRYWSTDRV